MNQRDKTTIEDKIEGMFNAVFEPRDEFMILSKSSQDLLLGQLQDSIVEGFKALEKDLKFNDKEWERKIKGMKMKCTCGCDFKGWCLCLERRKGYNQFKKEILK